MTPPITDITGTEFEEHVLASMARHADRLVDERKERKTRGRISTRLLLELVRQEVATPINNNSATRLGRALRERRPDLVPHLTRERRAVDQSARERARAAEARAMRLEAALADLKPIVDHLLDERRDLERVARLLWVYGGRPAVEEVERHSVDVIASNLEAVTSAEAAAPGEPVDADVARIIEARLASLSFGIGDEALASIATEIARDLAKENDT